jgi:hypothetical protein
MLRGDLERARASLAKLPIDALRQVSVAMAALSTLSVRTHHREEPSVTTVPDNPASRYHAILKEVRSGDVKRPLLEAWARALEVGSKDRVELARRMAATATLLSDINDHLAALPEDQFVKGG